MKLYRVFLKGLQDTFTGTKYGCPYVVAENADEALKKVQDHLNKRDLGFKEEREMDSIQLLAENVEYPDCKIQLFL